MGTKMNVIWGFLVYTPVTNTMTLTSQQSIEGGKLWNM